MKHKKNNAKHLSQTGVFMTIPFVLAIPPIVGWFIASKIQQAFDWGPLIVYIGLLLGFLSGFREVYRIIRTYGNHT